MYVYVFAHVNYFELRHQERVGDAYFFMNKFSQIHLGSFSQTASFMDLGPSSLQERKLLSQGSARFPLFLTFIWTQQTHRGSLRATRNGGCDTNKITNQDEDSPCGFFIFPAWQMRAWSLCGETKEATELEEFYVSSKLWDPESLFWKRVHPCAAKALIHRILHTSDWGVINEKRMTTNPLILL